MENDAGNFKLGANAEERGELFDAFDDSGVKIGLEGQRLFAELGVEAFLSAVMATGRGPVVCSNL